MNQDPFKEYIRESEPDKRDKGYAWHTAIGLQAVDGPDDRHKPGIVSFIENASCLILQYIASSCFQGFPVPRTFQCGIHAEPLHVMLVHAVQVRRKSRR